MHKGHFWIVFVFGCKGVSVSFLYMLGPLFECPFIIFVDIVL